VTVSNIPAACDTCAALVNLARYLAYTEGLSQEAALYLAENILGLSALSDPHNVRARARAQLQEAMS